MISTRLSNVADMHRQYEHAAHVDHGKVEKYAAFDQGEKVQTIFSHAIMDDEKLFPYMHERVLLKKADLDISYM